MTEVELNDRSMMTLSELYAIAHEDYRQYILKYGRDEAITILNSYIALKANSMDENEERYIQGAKDELGIE